MPRPVSVPLPILTLAFAMVFLMTSCRSLPVSPRQAAVAPGAGGDHEPTSWDVPSPVPAVAGLHSKVRGDSLYLYGALGPSASGPATPYDPTHPGGWMLQLLMNTDQAETGYSWRGIDYLVRGGEPLGDGTYVVRRVVPESTDPGGWGPQSGAARVTTTARRFVVAVPLTAIGDDDGRLDFVLETYATVACPDCEGGISHEWAAGYEGSTGVGVASGVVAAGAERDFEVPLLAVARPLPRGPRRSDTDAR
ncbi:MAG: hypothetical protein E6K81_15675 [Candidatus Eisenbacteria bacterium]|uniref:Lipoprotein n=1 Tax=Eiseniibacteriota bacterium TaxID=2212470 RepID=A0A538TZP6_UNCEI|nr:MAG: hypothetical protein E6K81_15675 [Candidatus Eisenbacteria bacterium]